MHFEWISVLWINAVNQCFYRHYFHLNNKLRKIWIVLLHGKKLWFTYQVMRITHYFWITFRMAPPLFHSFLQKGIYQWGKLDTTLFYFEWKSGGAIRKLFLIFKLFKCCMSIFHHILKSTKLPTVSQTIATSSKRHASLKFTFSK